MARAKKVDPVPESNISKEDLEAVKKGLSRPDAELPSGITFNFYKSADPFSYNEEPEEEEEEEEPQAEPNTEGVEHAEGDSY